MKPKKKMCVGYITALKEATRRTKKEFDKIDEENRKLDQMEMFNVGYNEKRKGRRMPDTDTWIL